MAERHASAKKIRDIFRTLEAAMGQQHWWPAGSAFEVVLGAYLTQNTAWRNVESALMNLRQAGALSVSGIRDTELKELEQLLRPAGYFRQKAARLKHFVAHLDARHGGSLDSMFIGPTEALREELLGLPGIGPETADSILLYAANREVFVVDTYTRRIFERHGLQPQGQVDSKKVYDEIRLEVQKALAEETAPGREPIGTAPHPQLDPASEKMPIGAATPALHSLAVYEPSGASQMERSDLAQRYNEFHALIVQTAKNYCVSTNPKCESCPLREMLGTRKATSGSTRRSEVL